MLNGSDEAFEAFKSQYISLISDVNNNSDFTDGLVYATGVAKENLGSFLDKTKETGAGIDELASKGSELGAVAEGMNGLSTSASDANTNISDTATSVGNVASNVGELTSNLTEVNTLISEEQTAFNNLKQAVDEVIEAINQKTEAIKEEQNAVGIATSSEMADFLLLKDKILEVKETLESFGTQDEGLISNIATAIESLNDIKLDEGLITQFNNLKEAIDSVTSAISGGSNESFSSKGQSNNSGSDSNGSTGKGSQNSGNSNSLTGAITEIGNTANEVIGEPDAEGDGTVIGEFGSLETAVNDVTSAIGSGESNSDKGSTDGESDNLIGSITDLGETTDETLGESGGDGVIGKFEELKQPIQEADEHVHGISNGLDEIDGKEVECTIKVNIETNGSLPAFASGTLGNMNLESGEYTAQYGKAFAEGTGKYKGLPNDEKNALVSEYGQTEMTVLPNGNTIITDEPTMMDLPKGTVIYNEDQTKQIMDNKVDVSGKAHTDGTSDEGWFTLADGHRARPLREGDRGWDLMQAGQALIDKWKKSGEEFISNAVFEHQKQFEKWTKEITNNTAINNVTNNRNIQPNINVGGINITCPGVTSQEVAKQVGVELNRMFNGLHLDAYQQSKIK